MLYVTFFLLLLLLLLGAEHKNAQILGTIVCVNRLLWKFIHILFTVKRRFDTMLCSCKLPSILIFSLLSTFKISIFNRQLWTKKRTIFTNRQKQCFIEILCFMGPFLHRCNAQVICVKTGSQSHWIFEGSTIWQHTNNRLLLNGDLVIDRSSFRSDTIAHITIINIRSVWTKRLKIPQLIMRLA